MTNNAAEQAVVVGEQGFFDAVWTIVGSGTSALAGWLSQNWGAIGLGMAAILVTYLATAAFKMVLDWTRDPRRKKPREMGDDTHSMLVRLASIVNGMWTAYAFGFAAQVGNALNRDINMFGTLFIGGLLNSAASFAAFHAWKWGWGPTDGAKRLRAILRIKSSKFLRVSETEIAQHHTGVVNLDHLQSSVEEKDDGNDPG